MQFFPAQPYRFLRDDRGLCSYPDRVAYTVAYPQENLDVPDLTYAPSSPESSSTSSGSSPRTPDTLHIPLSTELASTTPERVPRPRNAFIIFRCEYNPKIKAWIETITATKRKTNRNRTINQNIVSVIAGRIWRFLSDVERQPYREKAGEVKLQHRIQYPDYRYQPPSNKRIKRVDSTPVKRARTQKPYSRLPKKAPDASKDAMPLESALVFAKEPPSLDYMSTVRIRAEYVQRCYFTVDTATQPTLAPVEYQFGYRPDSTWLPSPPIDDSQHLLHLPSMPHPDQSPSFDVPENQGTLDALNAIGWDSLSSPVDITIPDSQTSTHHSSNMEFEQVIDGFLRSTSHYQSFAPIGQTADEGLEQFISQYR